MTTTRKWTAGAAALAVLILVGAWFLVVSPKRGEASDLKSETDGQMATNATLQTNLSVLKAQNKDMPKYQAQLAGLQARVPETAALPALIRQLTVAADKSGVELISLTPATPVPLAAPGDLSAPVPVPGQGLTPGRLAGINVDVVASGGFFEIQQFVNKVENLERYFLVGAMTIAEPDDTTTTTTTTTTSTDGGALTVTLNGRVFLTPTTPAEVVPTTAATTPTPAPTATPQS